VLSCVLLDEVGLSVALHITLNGELSNHIIALALDNTSVNVEVIKAHLGLIAVLNVESLPGLWHAGDLESASEPSNVPSALHRLSIDLAIVQDGVLADVALGKLSITEFVAEPSQFELTHVVLALAKNIAIDGNREHFEGHFVLFPILDIETLPDGIARVL
jgi:hypothetical protein